jgi:hypothetical protein
MSFLIDMNKPFLLISEYVYYNTFLFICTPKTTFPFIFPFMGAFFLYRRDPLICGFSVSQFFQKPQISGFSQIFCFFIRNDNKSALLSWVHLIYAQSAVCSHIWL